MNGDLRLKEIKPVWGALMRVALWASAIVGTSLTLPAQLTIKQTSTGTVAFLQFLTAILFGLFYAWFARMRESHKKKYGVLFVGLLFSMLVMLFVGYYYLQQEWTCPYAEKYHLVIGDIYTDDALAFIRSRAPAVPSCQELVAEYGGESFSIWPKGQLLRRHMVLATLFCLLWLISIGAMMSVVELVKNSAGTRSKSAKPSV